MALRLNPSLVILFGLLLVSLIHGSPSSNQKNSDGKESEENDNFEVWLSPTSAGSSKGKTNLFEIPYYERVKFGRESDLTEFFRKYVRQPATTPSPTYKVPETMKPGRGRGRGRTGYQKPIIVPKPNVTEMLHGIPHGKACLPLNKTVSVPVKYGPLHKILPRCVVVERCGGCCNDETHVCETSKYENVTHEVALLRYIGNSSFEVEDRRNFTFRRDTECQCRCKTKAENCLSPLHSYSPNLCRCICTNYEEHQRCMDDMNMSDVRYWDNDSCTCRCREKMKLCSSGFAYDHKETCACAAIRANTLEGQTQPALANDISEGQDSENSYYDD